MLGNTLLLVDDDGPWLKTTAGFFESLKFEVHTACTSADAVSRAQELRPDYILLDFHLGSDNAEALCRYIRSSEKLKKTNLLIVSGDETIRSRAYRECQADHFILKSSPGHILDVLNSLKRRIYWEKGIEECGDLAVQREGFLVYQNSKPVLRLTEDRFSLFFILVSRSPAFLSAEEIASRMYGDDYDPKKLESVKVLLCRLKSDLGPLEARIHNNRGEGWAYIPPAPQTSAPVKSKPLLNKLASLLHSKEKLHTCN